MSPEKQINGALILFGAVALLVFVLWLQDLCRIASETRKRELLLKLRKAERAVEHCAARKLECSRAGHHTTAEWLDKCLTIAIADHDTLKAQYEREFGAAI